MKSDKKYAEAKGLLKRLNRERSTDGRAFCMCDMAIGDPNQKGHSDLCKDIKYFLLNNKLRTIEVYYIVGSGVGHHTINKEQSDYANSHGYIIKVKRMTTTEYRELPWTRERIDFLKLLREDQIYDN